MDTRFVAVLCALALIVSVPSVTASGEEGEDRDIEKKVYDGGSTGNALVGTSSTTYTGSVLAPAPTLFPGGTTDNLAPCDPSSPLQGVDGYWIDIDPSVSAYALTVDNGYPYINFYDGACDFIKGTAWICPAPQIGCTGTDPVPDGTEFVIVGDWVGGPSPFTLTVA